MWKTGENSEIMGIFIVLILLSKDVIPQPIGKVDSESGLDNRCLRQLDFDSSGPCPEDINRSAGLKYPVSVSPVHGMELTKMDEMRNAAHIYDFNGHSRHIRNVDSESSPHASKDNSGTVWSPNNDPLSDELSQYDSSNVEFANAMQADTYTPNKSTNINSAKEWLEQRQAVKQRSCGKNDSSKSPATAPVTSEIAVNEPFKENVSYKCKISCTKETAD